jgi:hypothetical protein
MTKMTIRRRVEQNVVIWLLGTLFTGFVAGWGAYETILAVTGRTVVSDAEYKTLQSMPAVASHQLCEEYGVTLVQQKQEVAEPKQTVVVTGSVERLPSDYDLWLVASPSGSRGYWPRCEVKKGGRSWTVEVPAGLNSRDDRKHFGVFVVGPEGKKLIQQYREVIKQVEKHREVIRQVDPDREWPPPMTYMTNDMDNCEGRHEVVMK